MPYSQPTNLLLQHKEELSYIYGMKVINKNENENYFSHKIIYYDI